MKELIDALLTDENGISEEAFNALYAFVEGNLIMDSVERASILHALRHADATDGRFYFGD